MYTKSYFSSWEEYYFLQSANKKTKEYLWIFPHLTSKKKLILMLGINLIVKKITMILLWMWSTVAPFQKASSLQTV